MSVNFNIRSELNCMYFSTKQCLINSFINNDINDKTSVMYKWLHLFDFFKKEKQTILYVSVENT